MRKFAVWGVVGVWILACGGGADVGDEPVEAPPAGAEPPAPTEPPAAESRLEPVDLSGDRDPDCTVADFADAVPLLAVAQTRGGKPAVVRTPNGISETVLMDNGLELRVTRSGCHHYNEVWEAIPAPAPEPVKAMRKIAKHVVLTSGEESGFLNSLRAMSEDTEGPFDCCEICTCEIKIEGERLMGYQSVSI